jgi:hypothetical protein
VASIGFHLGREAVEGQKFNKPLRLFLKDDSSLNYIQPFLNVEKWVEKISSTLQHNDEEVYWLLRNL